MGFSRQEYWSGCHCLLRSRDLTSVNSWHSRQPPGSCSRGVAQQVSGCALSVDKAGIFNNPSAFEFPGGSDGKKSACNVRDPGLILGSGRSFGKGSSNPLQYSYLENPMDKGSWSMGLQSVRHNLATKPSPPPQGFEV